LTTGEGGMLLLDDEGLLARVVKLRDHGRRPGDIMFFNDEIGWKYKMSSMQAALGLAQIERVNELVNKKREIFSWYREELSQWNEGSLNPDVSGLFNSYWMTTVLLDPEFGVTKEALVPRMREHGIDVRPFFYPLSMIPAFRDMPEAAHARAINTVAQRVSPYGINLPSALNLDRVTIERVCNELRKAVCDLKG
jgi:perosamine synthetase